MAGARPPSLEQIHERVLPGVTRSQKVEWSKLLVEAAAALGPHWRALAHSTALASDDRALQAPSLSAVDWLWKGYGKVWTTGGL